MTGEVLHWQMSHSQSGLGPGQLREQLVQVPGPLHRARAVPAVQQQHAVLLLLNS